MTDEEAKKAAVADVEWAQRLAEKMISGGGVPKEIDHLFDFSEPAIPITSFLLQQLNHHRDREEHGLDQSIMDAVNKTFGWNAK